MSSPGGPTLRVSVAIALPAWQVVLPLELAAGATVAEALRAARPLAESAGLPPEAGLDWERGAVGIFGLACARSQALREGDRVELYRPLATDPKENRRRRAAEARAAGARRSGAGRGH